MPKMKKTGKNQKKQMSTITDEYFSRDLELQKKRDTLRELYVDAERKYLELEHEIRAIDEERSRLYQQHLCWLCRLPPHRCFCINVNEEVRQLPPKKQYQEEDCFYCSHQPLRCRCDEGRSPLPLRSLDDDTDDIDFNDIYYRAFSLKRNPHFVRHYFPHLDMEQYQREFCDTGEENKDSEQQVERKQERTILRTKKLSHHARKHLQHQRKKADFAPKRAKNSRPKGRFGSKTSPKKTEKRQAPECEVIDEKDIMADALYNAYW